uniref:Selenoprotein H n=1 Tax=Anopheles dirus TaxID=7168 RepID=A0A182NAS7_9DIPT
MAPRRKRAAAAKSSETTAKKAKPEEPAAPVEVAPEGVEDGPGAYRKAAEIHSELCGLAPEHNFQLVLNESGKPRRGAFEISVAKTKDDEKKVPVWSGLKKGPPRKDKFPEAESILDDILKALK